MGEAKMRRNREIEAFPHTQPIKRERFNLYTMGTRLAMAGYMSEELSWWSNAEETVLGFVGRDFTDNDYLWMILLRDRIGRFRSVRLEVSIDSQFHAATGLRLAMADLIMNGDLIAEGVQDDETNYPLDFFDVPVGTLPEVLQLVFRL